MPLATEPKVTSVPSKLTVVPPNAPVKATLVTSLGALTACQVSGLATTGGWFAVPVCVKSKVLLAAALSESVAITLR